MTTNTAQVNILVAVIDDNEAGRYALAHPLRLLGATVLEGDGGQAALRLAQQHPDAIFLDINMPDLNGFEVCRRLKADPRTAAIPVIFTTATSANSSSVEQAFKVGASNILFDPVSPYQAVTVLAGALVRAGRGPQPALRLERRTVSRTLPTVLCLDTGKARFATTLLLYGSGSYRVFTATNAIAAISVVAAITVHACAFCDLIGKTEISAAIQVAQACPEVPKVAVTSRSAAPNVLAERFGVIAVDGESAAVRLCELIASTKSESSKARELLRRARELREESRQLRREMRGRMAEIQKKLGPFGRE